MLIENELPAESANQGVKMWAELKKDGDKWVGMGKVARAH
jgi:hypothetical protein